MKLTQPHGRQRKTIKSGNKGGFDSPNAFMNYLDQISYFCWLPFLPSSLGKAKLRLMQDIHCIYYIIHYIIHYISRCILGDDFPLYS